ncbi:PIG-L family deacetylase [Cupriavidus sp. WKF15]|uniref:PIG-L deacetylase family protein n=1 Tax=Cupriavidus sp. WKF15 TaxID=3032282 RepID=UPI0023E240B4|nr:PIG-L deacetylase family protein [Cupriavidus sp. WKF15]WER48987.1 PIG-L family deacetylase [Cupriavidus sp. WKF15]
MECKRVFVLSPHADDAELGVGGYLARVIDAGGEVMVALGTVGASTSICLRREIGKEERLSESRESMAVLGVQSVEVLTEGLDGALSSYPAVEMIGRLDRLQNMFEPDEVLIPLPSSHQDHRYCWEVGIASTRPNHTKHVPRLVAAYEYPATFWGEGALHKGFGGGLYIDITQTWTRKLDALRRHQSQMLEDPGRLIGIEGATALAQLRGVEAGFAKAELLHVLRQRWS